MTSKKVQKKETPTPANDLENGLTIEPENQTTENSGQTKPAKSQTKVKWTVETENETRSLVAKAAKKAGEKLFVWVDAKLREAATAEITNKPQPPARPEDMVADIVQQVAAKFQSQQEANLKAQTALIEKQGQQIAALTETLSKQPKTAREWIFGKKTG